MLKIKQLMVKELVVIVNVEHHSLALAFLELFRIVCMDNHMILSAMWNK